MSQQLTKLKLFAVCEVSAIRRYLLYEPCSRVKLSLKVAVISLQCFEASLACSAVSGTVQSVCLWLWPLTPLVRMTVLKVGGHVIVLLTI